jgi:hypothetical protein
MEGVRVGKPQLSPVPKWVPLRRQGWASVIAQAGVQEFRAKEFWAHMKEDQTLRFRERLGDLTFPMSREAPGLQWADLFAYRSYRYAIKNVSNQRSPQATTGSLLTRLLSRTKDSKDLR